MKKQDLWMKKRKILLSDYNKNDIHKSTGSKKV